MRTLSILAFLLTSTSAWAGDARLEVPVAGRALTIGRLNLMIGLEPGLIHSTDTGFTAVVPLRFGITNDLELFASPVIQSFAPYLHEPALGGMYRFLDAGPLEAALRVATNLYLFQPDPSVEVQLGVPLRLHVGGKVAVDFGAHLLLPVLPDTTVGVLVPFGLTVNPTDHVFADASSALRIPDLTDANATLATPGVVELGYTFAKKQPNADLGVRSDWDDLQTLDAVSIMVFARIYFYP